MKRATLMVALLSVSLLGTSSGAWATGYALAAGDEAPSLRGKNLEGETHVVDYSSSKVTLVNFWATWCQPCRAEMPALQELYAAERQNGLEIVGVLRDRAEPEAVQQFLEGVEVTYPIIRLHRRWEPAWSSTATLPCSFLIDREGMIVRRYVGATPEQVEGLIYDLKAFLADEPLGPVIVPDKPNAVSAPPPTDP